MLIYVLYNSFKVQVSRGNDSARSAQVSMVRSVFEMLTDLIVQTLVSMFISFIELFADLNPLKLAVMLSFFFETFSDYDSQSLQKP
jgi:hypothetical protein